jgi:hypothetical protein
MLEVGGGQWFSVQSLASLAISSASAHFSISLMEQDVMRRVQVARPKNVGCGASKVLHVLVEAALIWRPNSRLATPEALTTVEALGFWLRDVVYFYQQAFGGDI